MLANQVRASRQFAFFFISILALLYVSAVVGGQTALAGAVTSGLEVTGGAVGDGRTDDTAALQSVLNRRQSIVLGSGKTYRITKRLNINYNGTGVTGDGTATLVMGSKFGEFDNESADYDARYHENAVGIYAFNVTRPIVEGVIMVYEDQVDDRYVKAIAFRNCRKIRIASNDISQFTKANGIIYVGGSKNGQITNNYIHDSSTNSKTWGQLTAIVFDDDDSGSSELYVTKNRIRNLVNGPDFLARFNNQTDGISPIVRSNHLVIADNFIDNVGEGIDLMGLDIRVERNIITNSYLFGIKLIHGASKNTIQYNIIRDSGFGGIVLSGSSIVPRDTADNLIANNVIERVNADHKHDNNSTFGIAIWPNGGSVYAARRNTISDNNINLGGSALFGIVAEAGSGSLNVVRNNVVTGWIRMQYDLDPTVVPFFQQ